MTGQSRSGRPRLRLAARLPVARGRQRIGRTALHEQVAQRLREMIVRGRLPPGGILGEAALCEALGISRTPLREALKHLASEGLVELRPNRSSRVTPIRTGELGELFEAVGGIERIAAELAAARATALELRRLRALHARMERHHGAAALDEYFHLNQQIHRLIVEMAKNSVLRATHDWLLARVERARFLALASRARWDESVQEHRDILTALEAGDGERAGRLLSDHVRRTGQVVAEALADQTASDSGDAIPVQPAPAAR